MIGPTSQSPIHRFPGRWRDPSQFRDEVASGHMPAVSCSSCLRVFPRSWRPMGTICRASSFIATESGAFRINSNTTKVLWATFGLCCVFFFVGYYPRLQAMRKPRILCPFLWLPRQLGMRERTPHQSIFDIARGWNFREHKHINNRWQPHSNMM